MTNVHLCVAKAHEESEMTDPIARNYSQSRFSKDDSALLLRRRNRWTQRATPSSYVPGQGIKA